MQSASFHNYIEKEHEEETGEDTHASLRNALVLCKASVTALRSSSPCCDPPTAAAASSCLAREDAEEGM